MCSSPKLIAAYHVLHRLSEPRHPPYALNCFKNLKILYNIAVTQKCNLLVITTFYSQYVKELDQCENEQMAQFLNENADGKVMNLQT